MATSNEGTEEPLIPAIQNNPESLLPIEVKNNLLNYTSIAAATLGGIDFTLSQGVQIGSRLIQAACSGRAKEQFFKEISSLYQKGKIKDNYINDIRSFGFRSFLQILQFIDSTEVKDEEKLKAMKLLFEKIISNDTPDDDEPLLYHLLQITAKLSSLQITIIATCYQLYLKKVQCNGYETWLTTVSSSAFRGIRSLVEMEEAKLVELKLIGKRTGGGRDPDGPFVMDSQKFRLTDSGLKLGEIFTEN